MTEPIDSDVWKECTTEQIMTDIADLRDTLLTSTGGPVTLSNGTIFCHNAEEKERIETFLQRSGYVKKTETYWEKP